jgi:tryptophan-rich sensory protein
MGPRWLAFVLGVLTAAGVWYANRDATEAWALVLSLYALSPWAFLALRAKLLGDRARGVALVILTVLTACMFVSIAADGSSTEALVFVFVPTYEWIAMGATMAIALLAKRRGSHHGDGAQGSAS